jgi:hypothetical protein
MVDQTFRGWNQIARWLRLVERLAFAAWLEPHAATHPQGTPAPIARRTLPASSDRFPIGSRGTGVR